jgi:hypothetical protein
VFLVVFVCWEAEGEGNVIDGWKRLDEPRPADPRGINAQQAPDSQRQGSRGQSRQGGKLPGTRRFMTDYGGRHSAAVFGAAVLGLGMLGIAMLAVMTPIAVLGAVLGLAVRVGVAVGRR